MDFLHRNTVAVWWRMTSRFLGLLAMKTLLCVSRLSTKKCPGSHESGHYLFNSIPINEE